MDIDVYSVLHTYIHTCIHIYAFLEKWIMLCMIFHNLTFHLSWTSSNVKKHIITFKTIWYLIASMYHTN